MENPKGYLIWQGRRRPPSRRSPRLASSCTGTQRVDADLMLAGAFEVELPAAIRGVWHGARAVWGLQLADLRRL